MESRKDVLEAEAAAESVVLKALERGGLFALEIKPRKGQSEQEIKEAIERSAATGWIEIGPADHYDPRIHITPAGKAELASRLLSLRAPSS